MHASFPQINGRRHAARNCWQSVGSRNALLGVSVTVSLPERDVLFPPVPMTEDDKDNVKTVARPSLD